MATYSASVPITGTSSGTATIRIESQLASSDSTGWNVNWQLYYDQANGYNQAQSASISGNASGSWAGPYYTTSYPYTFGIGSGSFRVNCDANGNGSYSLSASIGLYANSPYNSVSTSGSTGLPRIPLAPGLLNMTVDSITTNSARLGAELTSLGHGTSATLEMFYKKHTDSTYISLGAQADVAGYNYWSATGLLPATQYDYICNVTNNNGDFAQFTAQSFTTLVNNTMVVMDPF